MKLHRHSVRWSDRVRTVITLRPGTHARFSTNRFHETWHVLSDGHGARLLARLLWGLSYQARPGTVVLIDRPFLTPNPFDADPADPIVLVPGWCTGFDDRAARRMRSRLPLRHPDGTVRWRTFGLDRALEPEALESWRDRERYRKDTGRVARRCGLLVLTPGTPYEARSWALQAAGLDPSDRWGTDYTELGSGDHGYEGEVQIFRRFRPMVSVASRARAQVLARPCPPTGPDDLRPAVWREAERVRGDAHLRIREWQGRSYQLGRAAAVMLARADISSLDDLAEVGPVEAYRRMRAAGVPGLDREMLWAMEGALSYRDRRNISTDRRQELLAELGDEPTRPPMAQRGGRAPAHRGLYRREQGFRRRS
ncbi:TfoX/Sxy family DNA transformation protein [Nocardia sp. 2YAB30]|uniref:TfoX/Sxy family DNA transformation protein n=1 Tax=unclassified Nocardia TaxID=2637762 RepID=UPI003F9D94A1